MKSLAPNTQDWYRLAVEGHISPWLGSHRIDMLTADHIEQFPQAKEAEGLAPASLRWLYITLSKSLAAAMDQGLITANPVKKVTTPKVPQEDKTENLEPCRA